MNLAGVKKQIPFQIFFKDARHVFKRDELGREILRIALPTALALTADPIASLIDTAFIGHTGTVEVAAVAVAIALFNQVSKVTIFPLVSVTTSFVAEEETIRRMTDDKERLDLEKTLPNHSETRELATNPDESSTSGVVNKQECTDLEKAVCNDNNSKEQDSTDPGKQDSRGPAVSSTMSQINPGKKYIASASSSMLIGGCLGLFQGIFLFFAAKFLLSFMGVQKGSPMLKPATEYLKLRSLGSPAILLSLAIQGTFRGFKDTKTPLYATRDLMNIILDPLFIFVCNMGVRGAAIAHILSQYLIVVILFWRLLKTVNLLPPKASHLKLGRF